MKADFVDRRQRFKKNQMQNCRNSFAKSTMGGINSNQCNLLKSNGYKTPIGNNDNGDDKRDARSSKNGFIFLAYNFTL